MPITVELVIGIEVIRSNTMVHTGQTKKIVIIGKKAAFLGQSISVVNCSSMES
jgi:hypothetical protein